MILVTGAGGKTGQAIVQALTAEGATVRAAVRRMEQAAAVEELGAVEVVAGDLRSRDHLQAAAQGVDAVYHICPNMRPDELSIAQLVIRACQFHSVRRFLYHSVLHPQTEEMPHHWQKLRVEELLLRSDLDVTVIQPAAYMQNLLAYWPEMVANGRLCVPYAPTTRIGMVDLRDVAEAVARILGEEGHAGATYQLAGCQVFTQIEIAEVASQILGRNVIAEYQPREQWEASARAAGLHEYAIDGLLRMFHYYEAYGFYGNATVLTHLLGRPPVELSDFFRRLVR
jgi:NAD(P)H dehydrogenase (quinone)